MSGMVLNFLIYYSPFVLFLFSVSSSKLEILTLLKETNYCLG